MLMEILSEIPSYSEELGLDLTKPKDRFRWFLASILFAKRISSAIAKRTFRKIVENRLTTPDRLLDAGWDRLVEVLDSGGYVRYDFSTATNLLEVAKTLKERYRGSLEALHEQARDPEDLENRLKEFKGVGPTAVNIFLRELRGTWVKAEPKFSEMALEVAKRLRIKRGDLKTHEAKLVKIRLEYCKKKRCTECPVKDYCGR